MNTHADRRRENKSQSVANAVSQKQSGGESTFQFVDNRSEAVAQRKLQEIANNSPRAMQIKTFQDMANNSPQEKQAAQLQAVVNSPSSPQQHPIQKNENKTNSLLKSLETTKEQPVLQRNGDTGYGASLDDLRSYSDKNQTVADMPPEVLADFKTVQVLLHNEELVTKYLHAINNYIAENKEDISHREKFDKVAGSIEQSLGYGEVQTLTLEAGVQDGAKAVRGFAKAGQPFLDFGVSPTHGLSTHRLQQLIVGLAYLENSIKLNNPEGPVGVYKELGNPNYGVYRNRIDGSPLIRRELGPEEHSRTKLYAWELVLDRFQGKNGVYLIDIETGKDVVPSLGHFDAGIPISINLWLTNDNNKGTPHLSEAIKEDKVEHRRVIEEDADSNRAERQQAERNQRNKIYSSLAALGTVLAVVGLFFLLKKK